MSKFMKNRKVFKKNLVQEEVKEEKKELEPKGIVNYSEFGLDNQEDIKTMIKYEQDVVFHQQKSVEHLMALSETLYKAQKLLSNYKNGKFKEWFEALGLKKDFVYMCLKRYNLYLDYNNDKVMMIPEIMIKDFTKQNIFSKGLISEILEDEKPQEKYKSIKRNILSGNPTIYSGEILEAEVVDVDKVVELKRILEKKYEEYKKLKKEIEDLEYELNKLEKMI